jgi:hypothetical protein
VGDAQRCRLIAGGAADVTRHMSLSLYLLAVIVICGLSREIFLLILAIGLHPGAAPGHENHPWQQARRAAGAVVETP